jgi:hypothetical protein
MTPADIATLIGLARAALDIAHTVQTGGDPTEDQWAALGKEFELNDSLLQAALAKRAQK